MAGLSKKDAGIIVKDINFFADQLINNEVSSDEELIAHLCSETGLSFETTAKIIQSLRQKALLGEFNTTSEVLEAIETLFDLSEE